MTRFAEPMARLIEELKKMPGVGGKSAQRFASSRDLQQVLITNGLTVDTEQSVSDDPPMNDLQTDLEQRVAGEDQRIDRHRLSVRALSTRVETLPVLLV